MLKSVTHAQACPPLELGIYAARTNRGDVTPCSVFMQNSDPNCSVTARQRIVQLLESTGEGATLDSPQLRERAECLRRFIVENRLSRFADAFVVPPELEQALTSTSLKPVVIVVPESFCLGPAVACSDGSRFGTLLMAAAETHPGQPFWILFDGISNPTSLKLARRRFERALSVLARKTPIRYLPTDIDQGWLLEQAAAVFTIDSHFGFEALLRQVPVTVFGEPFYAGWGLTSERTGNLKRNRTRSLNELIAAALIVGPTYFDPVCDRETTPEQALQYLALQRRRYLENQGRYLCVGFSLWKRAILRRYLRSKGNQIIFLRDLSALTRSIARHRTEELTYIVVWASRPHADVAAYAERQGIPLIRLEDGFLRSTGLGSDWAAPGSLVFDRLGIYYDPRTPSTLEEILATKTFTEEQLTEALALREQIVKDRVSKYNTHQDRAFAPQNRPGQRVVLVPGQVADDASVRLGGTAVGDVEELLKRVRHLEPDAHILYKPHPDVLSGNRRGHVDQGLGTWFDELVLDVPLARCLDVADAVHTISSLVGFEALLREIPVTCHGQPFYSGWGLTRDVSPVARRQRTLTLSMLVAGTLLEYPRYYHFPSGSFCSAPQMAYVLAKTLKEPQRKRHEPKWLRRARSLLRLARDLRHAD